MSVRAHTRRRVTRRIPRQIIQSVEEIADDKYESGIGFDFDNKHKNIEGILVLRGAEAMTLVPGRARISEDSDRRYNMQRDYEVTAHTHSPDQWASTKYPSPDDIYAFLEDGDKLKREYNLIFISGKKTNKPQEVLIIYLPLEKQERIRNKYFRNHKTKKAFYKNLERDFFDKETIKMTQNGIDNPHNRKQMDKVLTRWNKRYGITFTRLSTKQLEDYEFRIKPQNRGRAD